MLVFTVVCFVLVISRSALTVLWQTRFHELGVPSLQQQSQHCNSRTKQNLLSIYCRPVAKGKRGWSSRTTPPPPGAKRSLPPIVRALRGGIILMQVLYCIWRVCLMQLTVGLYTLLSVVPLSLVYLKRQQLTFIKTKLPPSLLF